MFVMASRQTNYQPDGACLVAGVGRNRLFVGLTLGEVSGVDGPEWLADRSRHQVVRR